MSTSATPSTTRATIGSSVCVKGEISGQEDILIEGAVEGSINLRENSVTVAQTGKVKANVFGVTVNIQGDVAGDVTASEKVTVFATGKVLGNVTAPIISIQEGAKIKGLLNTEGEESRASDLTKLTSRIEEQRINDSSVRRTLIGPSPVQGGKNVLTNGTPN